MGFRAALQLPLLFCVFLAVCLAALEPNAHVKFDGPVYDVAFMVPAPADHLTERVVQETIDGKAEGAPWLLSRFFSSLPSF